MTEETAPRCMPGGPLLLGSLLVLPSILLPAVTQRKYDPSNQPAPSMGEERLLPGAVTARAKLKLGGFSEQNEGPALPSSHWLLL